MKKDNKKALYENIMTSVAKEVKKALNENIIMSKSINFNSGQFKEAIILDNKLYLVENDIDIDIINWGVFGEFALSPSTAFNNIIRLPLKNNNLNFNSSDVILVIKMVDVQKLFSTGFEKLLSKIDHIEIVYDENNIVKCFLTGENQDITLFTYKDILEKRCRTYEGKIKFISLNEYNNKFWYF
jgi:hypothetical protein